MPAEVISLRPAAPKASPEFPFSKTTIRAAIAEAGDAKDVTFRDSGQRGLTLRKQRKHWIFRIRIRVRGKERSETIATWDGANDIADIRARAALVIGQIKSGTREAAPKRAAALAARDEAVASAGKLGGMTLAEALDLHFEVNPQLRPKTRSTYTTMLSYLDPSRVRISAITPKLVRDTYDRLPPATGNGMVRSLGAIWNSWAAEHPEGEEPLRSPTLSITARRGRMTKVKPREGALTPEQRGPWRAAAEKRSDAALFIYLTGLRLREALGLSWAEVGADSIAIPASRMKGGVELVRPITPAMRAVLDRRAGPSTWVFPASRGPGPTIDIRGAMADINAEAGVDKLRPHDLRRTYAATAAAAGVPSIAIKLLLAHAVTDITDSYLVSLRPQLPEYAATIEMELLS